MTTKIEKFKLYTLPSKKEEQLPVLPLPTTSEEKSLNGKCGIAISKNSRNKIRMMITTRRRNKRRKESLLEEDIQLRSRDV